MLDCGFSLWTANNQCSAPASFVNNFRSHVREIEPVPDVHKDKKFSKLVSIENLKPVYIVCDILEPTKCNVSGQEYF